VYIPALSFLVREHASVLYSVSNHVAGVPGMLACLQEYHMCGENQAVKYRPFASIHVLLLVAGLSDLIVFTFTCGNSAFPPLYAIIYLVI
jgi:hypothetical protein